MNAHLLIADLENRTQQILQRLEAFKQLDMATLNHKSSTETWSALECIEHLNRYANYYHPEIEKRIQSSKYPAVANFKTGVLGNYFAKMMLPTDKMKKMKTFQNMNPNHSVLDYHHLEQFLQSQMHLLQLLKDAKSVNLTKTKTNISISKWIKLRLGDTFRVVIYHNERHILQAERAVANI